MARLAFPKTLRRLVSLLALAAVVEYLVLPQVAGARKSVHLLADANAALAVVGVLLEFASLVAYAALTRALLPPPTLSLGQCLRIDLATLSVSHVVPGGTAAGASLGYRLLTASGVGGPDVGFAMAAQGMGSAVVLNFLLWLGLLISIPLRGFNPVYGTAAVLGVLLIGFFAVLVVLLTRGQERAADIVRAVARRLPFLNEDRAVEAFRQLGRRVHDLTADRRLLLRSVGWATANWLLDAASLWTFLAAFGQRAPLDGLLVSYGLANVLAAIPVTPGGLGVVEGVLIPTLAGFHVTRGVAILGVLAWRLVNFWLPIPVGAGSYVSLRVGPGLLRADELGKLSGEAPPPLPPRPRPELSRRADPDPAPSPPPNPARPEPT
ncbi:MAG TPA: lysylphosphatidylglycerol synthase transmembrane domain-containing protein [Acidimicrobiales bacterium]|nr:lysylphosphatidylglycerol synthase transmembrane domain-containing protein [Acidimicrobiales bacterium]